MMREFNVTGSCNREEHYMVDISGKIEKIATLVNRGKYFTINRARQYGKTTTIQFLEENLRDNYVVLRTTFEGLSDVIFESDRNFNKNFIETTAQILEKTKVDASIIQDWLDKSSVDTVKKLGDKIEKLCNSVDKKIILIIDEVDKSCNHKLFLDFLGMLRTKYLERKKNLTFYSVILAGVHDIKTIRYSGSNRNSKNNDFDNNERRQDSPWNIAADFEVDMSFNPTEISTMLVEYEKDYNTGMDITEISNEIYKYTSGYPFLVSRICQKIEEKLDKNWTIEGVQEAVKMILSEENTLFDDMFKNFENNKELYDMVYDLLIVGMEKTYNIQNPLIRLGVTFGFLKNSNRKIAISNNIFERLIYDYFISKDETSNRRISNLLRTDVVKNGRFDMELTLKKFGEHYKSIRNETDKKFIERHCRIIFLTYIKPLINGVGFYHIESETLDARRMDIVLDYGNEQFVIELKLWYGDKMHQEAYKQLKDYLDDKNAEIGYLVTFDFRVKKEPKYEWVEYNGKKIFDVIVGG